MSTTRQDDELDLLDLYESESSTTDGPFKDLVISVSGSHKRWKKCEFPLTISQDGGANRSALGQLREKIAELGASFSDKMKPGCTHLVTTVRDVESGSAKVSSAHNAYTTEIVSLPWLLESEAEGDLSLNVKRLLESGYQSETVTAQKRARLAHVSDTQKPIIPAHKTCPFRRTCNPEPSRVHPWDALMVQKFSKREEQQLLPPPAPSRQIRNKIRKLGVWGRIGEVPHRLKATPCDLEREKEDFEFRFNDRTGFSWWTRFWHPPHESKYRYMAPGYVSRNPEDDPFRVENANNVVHNIPALNEYDVRKLPLGQLGREANVEGHELLANLSDLVKAPELAWTKYRTAFATLTARLSSQYFSLITHTQLIDDLADSVVANSVNERAVGDYVQPIEREIRELGLDEFTPCKRWSSVWCRLLMNYSTSQYQRISLIASYFNKTALLAQQGSVHTPGTAAKEAKGGDDEYIINIFLVRRTGEEVQFESSQYVKLPSVNFASILKQGLRGIYFSNYAATSLRFSSANLPQEGGFLLLAEVTPGDPINVATGAGGIAGKREGTMSTVARPLAPRYQLFDAGCVHPSLAGTLMPC
ncbi:hypothetical protein BDW69DRAFT_199781 [Aspergillus filifer]